MKKVKTQITIVNKVEGYVIAAKTRLELVGHAANCTSRNPDNEEWRHNSKLVIEYFKLDEDASALIPDDIMQKHKDPSNRQTY